MDVVATLTTDLPVAAVHRVVRDLGSYPDWLDIVSKSTVSEGVPDDPGPAWSIDLRGQVGPLRRSKRLRMVRTTDTSNEVVFERRELDGRSHSRWLLRADIVDGTRSKPDETGAPGTTLTMRLHYGGALWVPVLDRLLRDEIERSRPRLIAYAESR